MARKPLALARRYNKDNTISLYCRGYLVFRTRYGWENVDAFLTGWFGTADKSQWRVRNVFPKDRVTS